jgi:hypothetical protein
LQIKKRDSLPHILKGVVKLFFHNPNARVSHNYSIFEDLGQTPCAMSTLEVLQKFPSQRNTLLFSLGDLGSCGSKVTKFEVTDVKPHFPYHLTYQIHVEYKKYTIKLTVIDEGATMCVMSLTCWKTIGSPNLSQSMTMLTNFDGNCFRPRGIIPSFIV